MKATAVVFRRFLVVVIVFLAASGVGCGGGAADPASGNPVSLSQLPAAWAQTLCDQNFKCASQADIMMRTKADCVQMDTQVWQLTVPSIQDSQAKGRSTYSPEQMGLCLKALATETCAEWVTGLTHDIGCPEAFTAKVAVGGACQNDVECIGGYCDGADTSAKPPVDGMCKARVAHGTACTFSDTCVATDYCDGTANMCVGKKTGGTACASAEECGYDCNTDTNQCSGYAGCAVAPVTGGGTLVSLLVLVTGFAGTRRRRRLSLGQ